MNQHAHFDFADLDAKQRYKLLIGTVIPRPIALITTLSKDGQRNAGPFSFFNVLTHDPAIVAIGIENYEDGRMKDTSRNIRDTEEFTVTSSTMRWRRRWKSVRSSSARVWTNWRKPDSTRCPDKQSKARAFCLPLLRLNAVAT